jgi:TolB-like protein
VRLDGQQVWCDAVALLQHVNEGRWAEALALHRGELLEGLFPEGVAPEYQEWLDRQRRILRERAASAAWECSRIEEERGDLKAAAVLGRRAIDLMPDDENGVRQLMSLLDRQGDRGGALRVYSEWQARLQREYGVEPAPETRRLARRIQAARKGESHETAPTQASLPMQDATNETGAVSAGSSEPPGTAGYGRNRIWRYRMPAASVVVLAIVVGAVVMARSNGLSGGLGPASVAVLPLRQIGESEAAGETERVAEELTTALARLPNVTVRSVTLTDDPPPRSGEIDRIGRRLGVAFVVDGAVQRGLARLRVTLRLVRTSDGVSVWAGSYDETITDPMTSAQRVADDASRQIHRRLVPE